MPKKKLLADASSQRARLLAYLKEHGSATVSDLIKKLDILDPRPRVHELRHRQGVNIQTVWEQQDTGLGLHRVGRYVLLPGKYKGG